MAPNTRQIGRYAVLTFILTGAVLLGDVIYGDKVSFTHVVGIFFFTAALFAFSGVLKVIWNRRSPRAKSKSYQP
jgi:predicted benzoate:H+ symporter BenE